MDTEKLKTINIASTLLLALLIGIVVIVAFDTLSGGKERAKVHFSSIGEHTDLLFETRTEAKNAVFAELRDQLKNSGYLRSFILYDDSGKVYYAYARTPSDIHFATTTNKKYRSSITLSKREPYDIVLSATGEHGITGEAVYRTFTKESIFGLIQAALFILVLIALGLALIIGLYAHKSHDTPSVIYGNPPADFPPAEQEAPKEPREQQEPQQEEVREEGSYKEERSERAGNLSSDFYESPSFYEDSSSSASLETSDESNEKGEEGLYSRQSGFVKKMFLSPRLESEIKRAAAFDQDIIIGLVRCLDESKEMMTEYNSHLYEKTSNFFPFQDLLFEYDNNTFAVVLPNTDLDQGIEILTSFQHTLFDTEEPCRFKVAIGLSSRNGRLIDHERMLTETRVALKKAVQDPETKLIGFRPDPGKYRSFVAQRG